MNNIIKLESISKTYHTKESEILAIKDISLNINKGDIIGIVGPSGCGKSTLLNILASLDKASTGKIIKQNLKESYMLQTDALLPWLTVLDNATLGLKLTNTKTKENINYVKDLLISFGLENFIYSYPNNLSGGQRQRVALIRTLAIKPDIIYLDEPLSALDYVTRLTITDEIYTILKKMKVTTILITHDISECTSFCNKVIVLSKRPSTIKNIYEIKLDNPSYPSKNRQDNKFNYYYNLIWSDLDK